ncbi:LPXTG-motif cell wall anchor domain-containing protein [Curtobacterium sp. 314Chir4.1]|uniref:LPXTG cell wall anchor domain-containing protein n=1 Tax=Curtobacterium sp. 314Chir4.1 TaxID=1279028 RepID=UPI000BD32A94|nr:LPXTG cell wall anchor domain-containing protein [Curtobacterium sp. 314Chir4.1]SOC87268.1 LPXTG-motif cell wall anchor domain-containing protein [Curtobacterium sp. 314Chir4.1]
MHQSTRPPVRRAATIGIVVAATAIGSVIGVGASATAATPTDPTTPTSTTATATSTPSASPTPGASPAAKATGSAAPAAAPSDGSGLAFTEPSTQAAPLALTGTVGTPFSHTFTTTGGDGTVAYAIQDAPSADFTVNVETGVLSGTPTTAGTFDFEVVALSGSTQVTEYVRLTVSPSPVVFTEPGTKAKPLALTATAGTTFTHTFRTTGGTGSLAYAIQDSPSSDLSVNVETGVLTSTITVAGTYDFEVVALRGTATATEYVRLTVLPAAPVGVLAIVDSGKPGTTVWSVAPGGVITAFDGEGHPLGTVASIPVQQGGSLVVSGLAVDRFGNPTAPASVSTGFGATVASSVASDRIVADPRGDASTVTFPHASDHRLTITQGGVSTTFVVAVRPVATAAVATTTSGTGSTLAYTGGDETTPLAWAFGLLAAGGGLLLHRLRRRRA